MNDELSLPHSAAEQAVVETLRKSGPHGPPDKCFHQISNLWSAYLGIEVSSADVARLMVLLKITRSRMGALNPDDFIDAAGYMSLAGYLANKEQEL
ncbi:hypothetical protein LCGC14_0626150 [marine sediment metagenome]|uniref:DUF6378 domain-containing protein n=1 Tax=marine sediment metagenome TaxID=412755 RepID=A0A0F9R3C8_9ZZZZ